MHCVSARRKFLSQFRTHDAAAAVTWVDCDADVHEISEQYAVSGKQQANQQPDCVRECCLIVWSTPTVGSGNGATGISAKSR